MGRLSPIKPKHYLAVFQAARQGLSKVKIANELSVTKQTINHWLKSDPDFLSAYVAGRTEHKGANFSTYVYRNLPPDLQEYWDQMESAFDLGEAKLSEYLSKTALTKAQRQHLFVHALVVSNFNANTASQMTGTPHSVWRGWCNEPKFKDMVLALQDMKKNFVEGALMGLVSQGDSAAVIFANKTLNSDRGYNPTKKVEVSGTVEHTVQVSWDEVMERLPIATRREVIKVIQQVQSGQELKQLPARGQDEEQMLIDDAEFTIKEKEAARGNLDE